MLWTVPRDRWLRAATPGPSARGRSLLLLGLVTAVALVVTGAPTPAPAAPNTTDPEGGTPALRQTLATASQGYADARARLATSQRRQAELVRRQNETVQREAVLSREIDALAKSAYRDGRVTPLTAALDTASVPAFLGKSQLLDQLSSQNAAKLRALTATRNDLARQRRQLETEIKLQATQERAMAQRRADAEKALGSVSTQGVSSSGGRAAAAAPRGADGSFESQSCSIDDPTTTGCLTARTLHALQQARAAGFNRHTACFRQASFGEHQKGRACDFAAATGGFEGVAAGEEKAYGDRLASYFISNADRLGVLYVIWFKEIWLPGTGWRAYNGGNGDPASDHTNHLHLSVQ